MADSALTEDFQTLGEPVVRTTPAPNVAGLAAPRPVVDPRTTSLGGPDSLISNSAKGGGGVYANYPAAQLKYSSDPILSQRTQARLYLTIREPYRARFNAVMATDTFKKTKSYSEAALGAGYIDFFLGTANEQLQEKVQIVDLLSDDYVAYFFGQAAPTFTYTGHFMNTQQDDWWTAFSRFYTDVLRGSKLAQYVALAHLRYDSRLISGALVGFSTTTNSEQQMAIPFVFSLLVKEITLLDIKRGPGNLHGTSGPTILNPGVGDSLSSMSIDLASFTKALDLTSPTNSTTVAQRTIAAVKVTPKEQMNNENKDIDTTVTDLTPTAEPVPLFVD